MEPVWRELVFGAGITFFWISVFIVLGLIQLNKYLKADPVAAMRIQMEGRTAWIKVAAAFSFLASIFFLMVALISK